MRKWLVPFAVCCFLFAGCAALKTGLGMEMDAPDRDVPIEMAKYAGAILKALGISLPWAAEGVKKAIS